MALAHALLGNHRYTITMFKLLVMISTEHVSSKCRYIYTAQWNTKKEGCGSVTLAVQSTARYGTQWGEISVQQRDRLSRLVWGSRRLAPLMFKHRL